MSPGSLYVLVPEIGSYTRPAPQDGPNTRSGTAGVWFHRPGDCSRTALEDWDTAITPSDKTAITPCGGGGGGGLYSFNKNVMFVNP